MEGSDARRALFCFVLILVPSMLVFYEIWCVAAHVAIRKPSGSESLDVLASLKRGSLRALRSQRNPDGGLRVRSFIRSSSCCLELGIVTGNPRVFEGYPYPYPPKTRTRAQGKGFHGYGSRVLRVIRVKKPA